MSVIKMYLDTNAATYERAQVTLPEDGTLYGLDFVLTVTDAGPTSEESTFAELSFIDTPHYSTNGMTRSIAQINATTFFADAARLATHGAPRVTLTGLAIPVYAGEIIYMHVTPEGSIKATAVAYLFIRDRLR